LKRDKPLQESSLSKGVYLVARIISVIGALSLMPVLNIIDHTIRGMQLTWLCVLIGVVIALCTTLILKNKIPEAYFNQRRTWNLHVCFFVAFMTLAPSIANYINHYGANAEITPQLYKVDEVSEGISYNHGDSHKVYFLFIYMNNKRERFEIYKNLFDKLTNGGQVKLYVQHGALGYDFVKKFEAPDNW
jgi:hypothetical protein